MDENTLQTNQVTQTQAMAGTIAVPFHKHTGIDSPLLPFSNVSGLFPMVTTTPTWTPQSVSNMIALDSTTNRIWYYDITSKAWKVTAPIYPRVSSVTSGASITTNTDNYDAVSITALAVGTTIDFSGTPTNFQKMIVRIKDNGTSQTLAYGASLVAMGVTPPATTIVGKTATIGFIYDSVATQWGCVAYVHN